MDNDCDGEVDEGFVAWYADQDGDTYGDASDEVFAVEQPDGYVSNSSDCSDSDPNSYPGADELYDQMDNDCDGEVDEGFVAWYADQDSDTYGDASNELFATEQPEGYVSNSFDCDDSDAAINPDAEEVIGDGIDNNCDAVAE
jgi:hypothetical protein